MEIMMLSKRSRGRTFLASLLGCLVLALADGCEDNTYDHSPAAGMGSLVVDNMTSRDIDVYSDGIYLLRVDGGRYEVVDLDPGAYRIVLVEDDNDRSSSHDIDLLDGKLTIMDVRTDTSNSSGYDVSVEFQ